MGLHRLFLLGVARGRAPDVIAALDAANHPCVAETERRIREADVEQALLVAQSDDLTGLRALQERLTALGCAAFVSESTSWQARAWEALSAPWRGGVRAVTARLLTAKARAVLLSIAAFLALLAGLVAVSSLTSRDPRNTSLSPLERLTQTGHGAHAPSGRPEGADHEATPSQLSSGGGGGASGGARDDNLHDPTATPLEIGAFFAGLFLSLALGTLAARRLRAPGRGATRVAQSLGLMLLGVGLWAGTRPREVIRVAGTAREAAGGLTLAAGDESIDGQDAPDGGGTDGDGGTRGGAAGSRALRGPFDRFVRSIAIHTSGAPAPTFASLMESLRASAPATPSVTEGDPSTSASETRDDVADAGEPQGAHDTAQGRAHEGHRETPHATSEPRGEHRPHHDHAARHERHHASADAHASHHGARRSHDRGDAGAAVADASVRSAAVARSTAAAGSGAGEAGRNGGATGATGATTTMRTQGGGSSGRSTPRPPERRAVDVVRERPRLGPWFLVGVVAGAMLARRPRREAEVTS